MDWENRLLSIPTDQWIVDQVVVLDWYDGPRQGVCALANPAVEFVFDLIDEIPNSEGLDTRIVQLKELPAGSVRSFTAELERLGVMPANKQVWAPVWRFATENAHRRAEELVQSMETKARTTGLMISTADMLHFTKCWQAKAPLETIK